MGKTSTGPLISIPREVAKEIQAWCYQTNRAELSQWISHAITLADQTAWAAKQEYRPDDPRYVRDGMNTWVKCGPSCSLRVLGHGQTTCACRTQQASREE